MKKLFHLLLPYLNKKYFPGKGIRWIIRDAKGKTPYCIFCGSYANGVGVVKIMKSTFFIPLCKSHVCSYLDKHKPEGWEITAPFAIRINLKYKP